VYVYSFRRILAVKTEDSRERVLPSVRQMNQRDIEPGMGGGH
jgi:hypothetical protein